MESLRSRFLKGEKPVECNRCWHEEDNGKNSLRMRIYNSATNTSDFECLDRDIIQRQLTDQNYLNGPLILTIKNGNVCNAKCRVCHPNDSSRWIADSKKLSEILNKQFYALGQVEMNWSSLQIDEICQLSKNLRRLELFGGEPTYNKRVTEILRRLVDLGTSKNITLYINTNSSVDILEKWDFLTDFKSIEIGVSLDGVGAHFNYIRHGCDYQDAIANIKKWQHFLSENQIKYSIDSISTVNILNVYYLPELKAEVTRLLPLAPFWNLLINPRHLFIKNMPDHVKHAVIEKLQEDEAEFHDIINVIREPADPGAWEEFLSITQGLDQIRGESFADTFQEFAKIINSK